MDNPPTPTPDPYNRKNSDPPIPLSEEQEKRRYNPTEPLITQVRGLELRLCGVHWDDGSFIKYSQFYEQMISNAICVVHEFPPAVSEYSEGSILAGGISRLPVNIYNWEFNQGIWDLCRKYGRKIFTVDPVNPVMSAADFAMTFTSFAGIVGAPIQKLGKSNSYPPQKKDKKVSRREFLKMAGIIFSSSCLALGTSTNAELIVPYLENPSDRFLRAPSYGGEDFRNVKIAEGLEYIPSMLDSPAGGYILTFNGWAHTRAINYYLANKTLREIKEVLYYPTFNQLSACAVNEYSLLDGDWRKVSSLEF